MTVGKRIRSARWGKQLTLEEVAKKVGVTRQTISRYETDKITNIPSDVLEKLARALGVSPAWLMGWENDNGEADVGLATLKIKQRDGITLEEAEKRAEAIIDRGQCATVRLDNKELEVIMRYRAQPEMQAAVDKLLGITAPEPDNEADTPDPYDPTQWGSIAAYGGYSARIPRISAEDLRRNLLVSYGYDNEDDEKKE